MAIFLIWIRAFFGFSSGLKKLLSNFRSYKWHYSYNGNHFEAFRLQIDLRYSIIVYKIFDRVYLVYSERKTYIDFDICHWKLEKKLKERKITDFLKDQRAGIYLFLWKLIDIMNFLIIKRNEMFEFDFTWREDVFSSNVRSTVFSSEWLKSVIIFV